MVLILLHHDAELQLFNSSGIRLQRAAELSVDLQQLDHSWTTAAGGWILIKTFDCKPSFKKMLSNVN